MGNDKGPTFMLTFLYLSSLGIKNVVNGPQSPWYDIVQGVKGDHFGETSNQKIKSIDKECLGSY